MLAHFDICCIKYFYNISFAFVLLFLIEGTLADYYPDFGLIINDLLLRVWANHAYTENEL